MRSLRGPAYLVALGGLLVILRLPVIGSLGPLLGMGLVLGGVFTARGRATDPLARRRLSQAGALAVVVTLPTVVFEVLSWFSLEGWVPAPGELGPAAVSIASAVQMALGMLGTGLLTVALARECSVRGWATAVGAWRSATLAIVLVHGPILAAAVIVLVVGRPGGVEGALGFGLFAAAFTPYALIVRAGARSGPPLPSPSRGRDGVPGRDGASGSGGASGSLGSPGGGGASGSLGSPGRGGASAGVTR